MSIHRNILKVMTCLTVIGLTAAPVYAQQTTQQANCTPQNSQNCVNIPKVNPNMQPQGAGPYDKPGIEPGSSQVTPTNPQQQQSNPNSGNSN